MGIFPCLAGADVCFVAEMTTTPRESSNRPELTAALERALVRALMTEYRNANAALFGGALRPPALELSASVAALGRWHATTRTLEISRALVLAESWTSVVEVLKHEMAHQYAHEVLGARDETSHGPAFAYVCERHGIDARASGLPRSAPNDDEERMVSRIAKLLALAESPNQHEAEAAMAAAHRLMLKHNLDAVAQPGRSERYEHHNVGSPTGRLSEHERLLAMILGRYFFVEVIWIPVYRPLDAKRGTVLELCGTHANVAMAQFVHAFLLRSAEDLWLAHKRLTGEKANRDRRTFLAGVMMGFSDKLAAQSKAHVAQGLVWVKDGDLRDFLRRRHPYVRTARYSGSERNHAYAEGHAQGQRIVLTKPVAGPAESRGRLLPPRG